MELKARLSRGEPTLGLWVTLEAAAVSEIAATLGLDWLVVDTEHGALDFRETLDHVRAVARSRTAPLVRVPEIEEGTFKRVLDLGAEGLLVPMVRSAEEVRRAVRFAKYPPEGIRGIAVERATQWGLDLAGYLAKANRETLVIPIIENIQAADDFDAILDVPGVDAIFFGPFDFAASMGRLGEWNHPEVWTRIEAMRKKAQARGMPLGIAAPGIADARRRIDEGFRMIAVGFDAVFLTRAISDVLKALGRPAPGGFGG
jgi:2-keto-3-deoxy-L-rhamnonate aldolase RhmA